MSDDIEIKKRWFRSPVVVYPCPHCGSSLRSPIEEIGIDDVCPNCQVDFVVPGENEYADFLKSESIEEINRLKEESERKAESERRQRDDQEKQERHREIQIREARIREENERSRQESEEQAEIDRQKQIEGSPYWFIERAAGIIDGFGPRTKDFHWQLRVSWDSPKEARLIKKQITFAKKALNQIKRELNDKKKAIRSDAAMQRMMIGKTGADMVWYAVLSRRSVGYMNTMKRIGLSQQVAAIISGYDEAGRLIDHFKTQLDALSLQIDHWLLKN